MGTWGEEGQGKGRGELRLPSAQVGRDWGSVGGGPSPGLAQDLPLPPVDLSFPRF